MFRRILDLIKPPTGNLLSQLSLCLRCHQYKSGAVYALDVPQKKLAREIEYYMRDARSKYRLDKSKGQGERYHRLGVLYHIIFEKFPSDADSRLYNSFQLSEDDTECMNNFREAVQNERAARLDGIRDGGN